MLPVAESTTAICCAAGSIARRQIRSSVRCMPRNANGLSWRAATMASTCGSGCCGTLALLRPGQNPENPFERDVDPGGPVRQLVRYFVDCLFEHEKRRQLAGSLLVRRIRRATAHSLAITAAKAA